MPTTRTSSGSDSEVDGLESARVMRGKRGERHGVWRRCEGSASGERKAMCDMLTVGMVGGSRRRLRKCDELVEEEEE